MTVEYEARLSRKEDEIVDLKKKIDDMSNEFARMLRVFCFSFKFSMILLNFNRKHWIKCKKELNLRNGMMNLTLRC